MGGSEGNREGKGVLGWRVGGRSISHTLSPGLEKKGADLFFIYIYLLLLLLN